MDQAREASLCQEEEGEEEEGLIWVGDQNTRRLQAGCNEKRWVVGVKICFHSNKIKGYVALRLCHTPSSTPKGPFLGSMSRASPHATPSTHPLSSSCMLQTYEGRKSRGTGAWFSSS